MSAGSYEIEIFYEVSESFSSNVDTRAVVQIWQDKTIISTTEIDTDTPASKSAVISFSLDQATKKFSFFVRAIGDGDLRISAICLTKRL